MQTENYAGTHLLNVLEARRTLRLSHTKFYELVKDGQIPIVKIGRSTRVRSDDLDRFIRSLSDKVA